ncbi:hypothetical protein CANCADRAFT_72623 [Tortispora caseinolytica NRRL Y-17796]|uniref:Mitochondrial aspartate-glutamate transporter AGC1 n=1 Tax=Tortispora caseinolytica NRRL Y-17796 TaxID=767744 RepID=A0A1E4TIH3_9ASCO|nr:hypothetical protein CANCADRAFT_72623 [Tortispora caseinolytica NRRL Y-17796]
MAPISPNLSKRVENSRAVFNQFSVENADGQRIMTPENFVNAIAPENENYTVIPKSSYIVLFAAADRACRGYLTVDDWIDFERVLATPDAEYRLAFRVFDPKRTGSVDFDQFVKFYNENKSDDALPFDWNNKWTQLYVGSKNKRHRLTYEQFSQMLKALHGERVRQAFLYYDKAGTGYISTENFKDIMIKTSGHKLSAQLISNLDSIDYLSSKVSYATVRAFENLLREFDIVKLIVYRACSKSSTGKISKSEFAEEATRSTQFGIFSPLEIDLLFRFASMDNPTGLLSKDDFDRVLDPSWRDSETLYRVATTAKAEAAKKASIFVPSSFLGEVFESVYHFALGSVAGAFGATIVYPIDLVKTRMQNQRSSVPGQLMYKNSMDCFKKVVQREGFRGLYSGLGPQLIGVAPEKAIKLTVNDLVRGKLSKPDGSIEWPAEVLAGGSAGACQVVFTNPLEIVKIRLQVQGEAAKAGSDVPKRSAISIVRSLGLVGLYKGATACLLRDVPFSAIYFPTYAHLKKDYFGESTGKRLNIGQLLIAGAVAGMPAAYFTTPFDVIKTRLQVEARKGQTHYRNLMHCATTVFKEEGFAAFFKGGPARIFRSSPQFGCTLAMYELLQSMLPVPESLRAHHSEAGHAVPTGEANQSPISFLRSRNALRVLMDIDQSFGRPTTLTKEQWNLVPGLKK